MTWVYTTVEPFYDISPNIGQLQNQMLDFILSFSPSFYVTLFSMATVGFIIYLIWYIRYAVNEANTLVSRY